MAGERTTSSRRSWVLAALAVPPTAWALHLLVSYWLVPVACESGTNVSLHLTTAAALAASLGVAALGWRIGRGRRRHRTEPAPTLEDRELRHPDASGLGPMAVLMGVYFALVIGVTGLVAVVQGPCT